MFWKVLWYASQHDSAVWKFLEDYIYNNYSWQTKFWNSKMLYGRRAHFTLNFLQHEILRLLEIFWVFFLKSHPGYIVDCFTVNTFAVRHFTVSLQCFEFCSVESEEKLFKMSWLECLRTLCTAGSAKRTTSEFFHFLEALEDSK